MEYVGTGLLRPPGRPLNPHPPFLPPPLICRVRSMLASRACRYSIMVGRPLSRSEMRAVLRGLAGLRAPWNCPHGRPTMRHVCVLPDTRAETGEGEEGALLQRL